MGQPGGESCRARQEIIQQLVSTMEEIFDLGAREVAAVTNGNPIEDINHIERNLEQALVFKSVLLKHYISHRRNHR